MKKIVTSFFFLTMVVSVQAQTDTSFTAYEQQLPGSAIKFNMVPIVAGSFLLGTTVADRWKEEDETPQHKIQIDAFWMGAYEVTFDEYNLFFSDVDFSQNTVADAITRPSPPYIELTLGMGKEGGFPANSMQQYGALMYCKWLYKKTGIFYRLPTEAEWEYACRAGTVTTFPFGNDAATLKEYAWFSNNSEGRYHKVGLKKPNAWGLYDMLGNVAEWTLDQYKKDYYSSLTDGTANPVSVPQTKHPRSVKGGSYQDAAKDLRPASRLMSDMAWNRRDPQIPKSRWWNADAPFIGFRIVRPLVQPTAEEIEKFFTTYLK
jgi:formylglycine-generating enzyme required for sulfatase activity